MHRKNKNTRLRYLYEHTPGHRCYICGCEVDFDDYERAGHNRISCGPKFPTIDHVVPVSRGGTDEVDNLRLCCNRCNGAKRDNDPAEYTDDLPRCYKDMTEKAPRRKARPNNYFPKAKEVLLYKVNEDGVEVHCYKSTYAAHKDTGLSAKAIQNRAREKGRVGGYQARYAEDFKKQNAAMYGVFKSLAETRKSLDKLENEVAELFSTVEKRGGGE